MDTEEIARVCHEVNRALCEAFGDHSQPAWADAPEWQRQSTITGVAFCASNSPAQYVRFIADRVPGVTGATIINDAFLNSPTGIQFLKAQAWHEAGKPYPAPAGDWIEAQQKVFGKPAVKASTASTGTGVVIGTGAATVATGVQQGWTLSQWLAAAAILVAIAVAAIAAVYFLHRRGAIKARETALVPPADDTEHLVALLASVPEGAATSPRKRASAAKAKRPRKKAARKATKPRAAAEAKAA